MVVLGHLRILALIRNRNAALIRNRSGGCFLFNPQSKHRSFILSRGIPRFRSCILRGVRPRCHRRIPAGCQAQLSVSTLRTPIQRVAERRNSQPRIAATIGLPYGKARPVSERELPVHNADRRASRRSTAAFSSSLGTDFRDAQWPPPTTIIPRDFAPRSSAAVLPSFGRPHVVEAIGGPEAPGGLAGKTEPSGAAPAPPTSATG